MTTNGARSFPDNDELAATLRQLDDVRRRTHAAIHPAWFPMLLFGILGLVSVPFALVGDGTWLGLYWFVAGPAGGFSTSQYYRRRTITLGVGVRGGAYVVLGVALFVAAFVAGTVTHSAAAPMMAIAIAYLGFARLERSWPVALVSLALGVAALVVAVVDPSYGDVLLSLVYGVSFTVTGLLLRRRDATTHATT